MVQLIHSLKRRCPMVCFHDYVRIEDDEDDDDEQDGDENDSW